jgi:predicted ATPase
MLIRFIGSPGSGKTTISAKVFAHLKETGYPTDFVTEFARQFIAYKKVSSGRSTITLKDEDQLEIMGKQIDLDQNFSLSCGPETIIITDTCPLNALFYMSSDFRDNNPIVQDLVRDCLSVDAVYFYSPPVQDLTVSDPNRVHSREQSLEVDKSINQILAKFANNIKVLPLFGDPDQRMKQVLAEIYGLC